MHPAKLLSELVIIISISSSNQWGFIFPLSWLKTDFCIFAYLKVKTVTFWSVFTTIKPKVLQYELCCFIRIWLYWKYKRFKLYVEDFGGGEIQKDTRVKLRLWHLGARSKCSWNSRGWRSWETSDNVFGGSA